MENNIILLEDENGVEIEFEVIDVYELDGETFFAMIECLPEEEQTDDLEVLIMRVEGDIESEEAELVPIEDEALLQKAFDEFVKRDEEAAKGE
ncbi:MAG: DUF1292 domain-containing protein [Clostridia bacterium]|nr:DUF1292 domain-containing protein [Clostridia bacterium]MEE0411078.1 DUF1292 domain-containing protein [Clostridia bacterium]